MSVKPLIRLPFNPEIYEKYAEFIFNMLFETDHTEIYEKFTQLALPKAMLGTLQRYLTHGCRPDPFLTAVLENNLVNAIAHADEENYAALQLWVKLIYNYFPLNTWGDERIVSQYCKRMQEKKLNRVLSDEHYDGAVDDIKRQLILPID